MCLYPFDLLLINILKEIKKYGKEVPLGTMLKILKAKGTKERKDAVQNESTPAAHQVQEYHCHILYTYRCSSGSIVVNFNWFFTVYMMLILS